MRGLIPAFWNFLRGEENVIVKYLFDKKLPLSALV